MVQPAIARVEESRFIDRKSIRDILKETDQSFRDVMAQLAGEGDINLPDGSVILEEHKFDAVGSLQLNYFMEEQNNAVSFSLDLKNTIKKLEDRVGGMFS